MNARILRVAGMSPAEDDAWRRLVERSVEPNPFAEPDYLHQCVDDLAECSEMRLAVVEHEGEMTAALRIAGAGRRRIPPRPVADARGRPTALFLLNTPLVAGGRAEDSLGCLLGAVEEASRSRELPGILRIERLRYDGPIAGQLGAVCARRGWPVFVEEEWQRGLVTLDSRLDGYLPSKRRRELERKERQLSRDGGAEVQVTDRTGDIEAAETFLRMEMSGWKGSARGRAFGLQPQLPEWFRTWHRRSAGTGRMLLLSLDLGGSPVACSTTSWRTGPRSASGWLTMPRTTGTALARSCSTTPWDGCATGPASRGSTRAPTRTARSASRCCPSAVGSPRSSSARAVGWTGASWRRPQR